MFSLNPRALQAVSDSGCGCGQGPRGPCSLEVPPACQNTSFCCLWVQSAAAEVTMGSSICCNSWWLFSHRLQCQIRIMAPNSQLLRGCPHFSTSPICFPLEAMSAMGESRNCSFSWSQVFHAILCLPLPACVQGQMGVFPTQHFHNPVCFHLTPAQVKRERRLPLPCAPPILGV